MNGIQDSEDSMQVIGHQDQELKLAQPLAMIIPQGFKDQHAHMGMAELIKAPGFTANSDKELRILDPTRGRMAQAWSAGYKKIHK